MTETIRPEVAPDAKPHTPTPICRHTWVTRRFTPGVLHAGLSCRSLPRRSNLIDTNLNHVTVTGILERDPIVKFADHGMQVTSFTVKLTEVGPVGEVVTLYVPCEAYGQGGVVVGDLSAGAAVLVAGKLKWTSYTAKDGSKKTNLCILARLVKVLAPAAVDVSTLQKERLYAAP